MLKKHSLSLAGIAFAIIIFANIGSASAQVKFGIKAGYDVIDHKIDTDIINTKNRLGFHFGAVIEFGIPILGGIETGLLYGYKEYKTEFKDIDAELTDYHYLTLPLNLKKRWDLGPVGIFVHGGPYATLKLEGGDLDFYLEEIESKRFGAGVNAGFGFTLFKKLDLGLQYRIDLTDRYATDKGDIANFAEKKYQTWSVGAGYYF